MKIEIEYLKKSLNFFEKNAQKLSRDACDALIIKAAKKIYKLSVESIDLKKLRGVDNAYRIRKGDIRIIFTLDDDHNIVVITVENIDFRGSAYQ